MKSNISADEVAHLIRPGGPLQLLFPSFEYRKQQEEMMLSIIDAFNERGIALVEAATGTGKSLAYLLPAAIKAVIHGERTVISTRTIPLQEQILHKDLPIVSKLLGTPIHAVLVKGIGNYVCIKKLEETMTHALLLPQEEQQVAKINEWTKRTKEGSRSELSFTPSPSVWEQVGADSDSCTGKRCPHYDSCFLVKARRRAEEASLIISNHSLLFADIALKRRLESGGILPSYKHVVFDEAHHLEDVATDFFSSSVSRFDFLRVMGRLASEKAGEASGRLQLLRKSMNRYYSKGLESELLGPIKAFGEELTQLRRELLHQGSLLFDSLLEFYGLMREKNGEGEAPLRLQERELEHPFWREQVAFHAQTFSDSLQRFISLVIQQCQLLEKISHEAFQKENELLFFEIRMQINRLDAMRSDISRILLDPPAADKVRYLSFHLVGSFPTVSAIESPLDISELIHESFEALDTALLASATMTAEKSFSFIKSRLGVGKSSRPLIEKILSSPFDFKKQCALFVPTDLPLPGEVNFEEEAIAQILASIKVSRGGAFVLFTSFAFLDRTYQALQSLLKEGYTLLRQGDMPRRALLQEFLTREKAVLLGTDSFWEGIDVQGDRLRLVIIPKLPFRVPSEPLFEARTEALKREGRDPFKELALPLAALKLKQGFGRLIRHKSDRGAAIILDGRILRKNYGKSLLQSLPPAPLHALPKEKLAKELFSFFRSLKS